MLLTDSTKSHAFLHKSCPRTIPANVPCSLSSSGSRTVSHNTYVSQRSDTDVQVSRALHRSALRKKILNGSAVGCGNYTFSVVFKKSHWICMVAQAEEGDSWVASQLISLPWFILLDIGASVVRYTLCMFQSRFPLWMNLSRFLKSLENTDRMMIVAYEICGHFSMYMHIILWKHCMCRILLLQCVLHYTESSWHRTYLFTYILTLLQLCNAGERWPSETD